MKILVISNFYPPFHIGGYEIGCQEAVEGLRLRGHPVKVLTSNYGITTDRNLDDNVYRKLKLHKTSKTDRVGIFIDLFLIEIHNHWILQRLISKFKPDLVYVWNLVPTSVSLLFRLQKLKVPIFYFVFDHWLSKWKEDLWYKILDSHALGKKDKLCNIFAYPFLKLTGFFINDPPLFLGSNVQFASQYLKNCSLEAGQTVKDSMIIPWGLKIERYPYTPKIHCFLKLLYVGQLVQHKGVHTAIKALQVLVQQSQYESMTLTIVGGTTVPSYEEYLKELVVSLGLNDRVHFQGFIDRESLISTYKEHDILLFPSTWEEPFGITLLEGMALGLPIVCTNNGGSKEIVKDGYNSLIFPSENHYQCAERIMQLINNPSLSIKMTATARIDIEEKFNLNTTLDRIENSLSKGIKNTPLIKSSN
jgi:glycosyltransferase involved in cell wall biosynthesis